MKETLEDLDKKGGGRDIENIRPVQERFSTLKPNEDWVPKSILSEGLETNVTLGELMCFVNPSGGEMELSVRAPHWRTITREGVLAKLTTEKTTDYFYEANVKGCGYLKPTVRGKSVDSFEDWTRINEYGTAGAYGIADIGEFNRANGDVIEHTRSLIRHGLRTELYGAWGKLKYVYFQGKKVPVQKLRDQAIIPNTRDLVPAIGVRFLKTNTRAAEFISHDDDFALEIIKKAFETFNRENVDMKEAVSEVSIDSPETHSIFFSSFVERMAQNLAILNNLGLCDYHLHSSNVTMASEVVDIGIVFSNEEVKSDPDMKKKHFGVRFGYIKDMRDVSYTISKMLRKATTLGLNIGDRVALYEKCVSSFTNSINEDSIKNNQQIKVEDAVRVFSFIMRKAIIEDSPLKSLKKVGPENWDLE